VPHEVEVFQGEPEEGWGRCEVPRGQNGRAPDIATARSMALELARLKPQEGVQAMAVADDGTRSVGLGPEDLLP
jgi:hypothetical protein